MVLFIVGGTSDVVAVLKLRQLAIARPRIHPRGMAIGRPWCASPILTDSIRVLSDKVSVELFVAGKSVAGQAGSIEA